MLITTASALARNLTLPVSLALISTIDTPETSARQRCKTQHMKFECADIHAQTLE